MKRMIRIFAIAVVVIGAAAHSISNASPAAGHLAGVPLPPPSCTPGYCPPPGTN